MLFFFFRSISFKITQRLFCAHLCKLWHTLTRRETSIYLNLAESKNMDAHGNLPADLDMPEQWWNASWPLNQGQVAWDQPTLPLHSWYSDWHLWSRFCSAGKKNGTQFSSTVNAVPGTRLSNKVWSPSQEVNEKISAEVNENTTKIPSVLTKLFYECSVFVRAFELLTVQLWMWLKFSFLYMSFIWSLKKYHILLCLKVLLQLSIIECSIVFKVHSRSHVYV